MTALLAELDPTAELLAGNGTHDPNCRCSVLPNA
jgi:hypothetical protein